MQESSCVPDAVGQSGEQGLMQLTRDKCLGAPSGDCSNPVSPQISPDLDQKNTHSRTYYPTWLPTSSPRSLASQDFNIQSGAAYFSATLEKNRGDLLLSIGQYNGWSTGMTIVSTALHQCAIVPGFCFSLVAQLHLAYVNAIGLISGLLGVFRAVV